MNVDDYTVRYAGEIYRMVVKDGKAGLFTKGGLKHRFHVSADSTKGRLPALQDDSQTRVMVSRAARPCSCKGYPWNTASRELKASI